METLLYISKLESAEEEDDKFRNYLCRISFIRKFSLLFPVSKASFFLQLPFVSLQKQELILPTRGRNIHL